MKCEKCNKNEATFHSVKNINGKVSEKHLCNECAKEEKEFDNFNKEFLDFDRKTGSFFDDMLSDFKTSLSYFSNPMLDNFLGFDDFLESPLFLENKQENKREKENDKKENVVKKSDFEKKLSDKEKLQLEIAKLDISLKKAVVEERYEDAVKLRDKIKELKAKLEK